MLNDKGLFIVFEGIDGSGKGTQIRLLREFFERIQLDVTMTKEPGGTQLGLEIRQILFHTVTTKNMAENVCDALFLADHIQNVETVVKPALARGEVVISDRFAYSQFAYSVARPMNESLRQAYEELLGVEPDLIFLLDGDPEVLLDRANKRVTETHQQGKAWNQVDRQRAIQQEYYKILSPKEETVYVNTTNLTPDEIFNQYVLPAVAAQIGIDTEGQVAA